jgi:hypothetical protein
MDRLHHEGNHVSKDWSTSVVVGFLGQCVDGEDQLFITEFAPLGSLDSKILL